MDAVNLLARKSSAENLRVYQFLEEFHWFPQVSMARRHGYQRETYFKSYNRCIGLTSGDFSDCCFRVELPDSKSWVEVSMLTFIDIGLSWALPSTLCTSLNDK